MSVGASVSVSVSMSAWVWVYQSIHSLGTEMGLRNFHLPYKAAQREAPRSANQNWQAS